MGARLPNELLIPNVTNPSGFWEPVAAVELHDRLFDGLGTSWDDPRAMPEHWQKEAPALRAAGELDQLLDEWLSDAVPIVVKDPRLCRLAPLWFDRLDERGVETVTILSVRDPHEVVGSVQVRDGFTGDLAAWLWLADSLSAEHASRGRRRLTVSYNELLTDTAAVRRHIATDTGLDDSHDNERDIAAFLDPFLRHHHRDNSVPAFNPPLEELAQQTFKALSAGPEPDTGVLDDVASALEQWQPLLKSVYAHALNRSADEHLPLLAAAEDQRQRAEHDTERTRHELTRLHADHRARVADLISVQQQLASAAELLHRTQQSRSLRSARAIRRWLGREIIDPPLQGNPPATGADDSPKSKQG